LPYSPLAWRCNWLVRRATVPTPITIFTGSLALGGGIWAMHFLGMLAFELCAAVRFDLGITLLSMLPSLAASWVALSLLARRDLSLLQLYVGGRTGRSRHRSHALQRHGGDADGAAAAL